jgi:protein involved in polysaccharide export with SLBB domain
MKRTIVIILAVLMVVLLGCETKSKTNTINQFNAEYQRVKGQGYQIQPGDTLDITFFYTPEYNATSVPVRPDGKIQLSLVGEFPIAGMTPEQAGAELKKAYTRELKNPDLAVIVKTFGASAVVVQGEVRTPAQIPLIGNATLLQVISQAGSFLPTADIRNVTVVRHSTGGKPLVTVVNLQDALKGVDPANDIPMLPGDVVFVPSLKQNDADRGRPAIMP